MTIKNRLIGTVATLLLALATMPSAQAQTAPAPAPNAVTSPYQTCAAEQTPPITLPAKGSGQRLTKAERHALHKCVEAARKVAFNSCAAAAQPPFTPGAGVKPTAAQKSTIEPCMVEAGFKHHRHHRHWDNGQKPAQNS